MSRYARFFLLPASWLFILGASWSADGLRDIWLAQGDVADPWGLGVGLVCFIGGSGWLYWKRRSFLPVATLQEGGRPIPHAALIVVVSPPNQSCPITPSGNLRQDIEVLDGKKWNWQQLLRGVEPHADSVRRLVLIGSSGEEGSHSHLKECCDLLARYLPAATITFAAPTDFQKLAATQQTIEQAITELMKGDYAEKEILIDVTGGPKTASIAAALATLRHRRIEFQYVEGSGDLRSYNVVIESAPALSD